MQIYITICTKLTHSFLFQGLCKERVSSSDYTPQLTFISLKGRLTEILKKALEAETDSENTQLLFAGLWKKSFV